LGGNDCVKGGILVMLGEGKLFPLNRFDRLVARIDDQAIYLFEIIDIPRRGRIRRGIFCLGALMKGTVGNNKYVVQLFAIHVTVKKM
jgi:hypothetical protein